MRKTTQMRIAFSQKEVTRLWMLNSPITTVNVAEYTVKSQLRPISTRPLEFRTVAYGARASTLLM